MVMGKMTQILMTSPMTEVPTKVVIPVQTQAIQTLVINQAIQVKIQAHQVIQLVPTQLQVMTKIMVVAKAVQILIVSQAM